MVLARLHCLHHNPAIPAIHLLQKELDVPGANIIHCIPYHSNYKNVSTADFDRYIHVPYTKKNPNSSLIFHQSVCDATSIEISYPGSGQSHQGGIVSTCANVHLCMVAEKWVIHHYSSPASSRQRQTYMSSLDDNDGSMYTKPSEFNQLRVQQNEPF